MKKKKEKPEKEKKPKKEKRVREKKPKKEKPVKEKKPKKAGKKSDGEETGGKKSKKKLLIPLLLVVVVAAVAVVLLMRMRGGDDSAAGDETAPPSPTVEVDPYIDPPPSEYIIGSVSVPALPVSGDGITVRLETDDAGAESYVYEGLQSPAGLVSGYSTLMTLPDAGYMVVDDALKATETLPDFTAEEGSLRLARTVWAVPVTAAAPETDSGDGTEEDPAEEEPEEGTEETPAPSLAPTEHQLSILLNWSGSANSCTVSLSLTEVIPEPPVVYQSLSLTEALDRIKAARPADLDLPGTSMDDYNIYSLSGIVFVGDTPCLQMNVYAKDPDTGTNEIAGMYFLSHDGQHLYRRSDISGTLAEIDIPW